MSCRSPGIPLSVAFAAPPLIRHGALEDEFVGQIVAAFGIRRDRVLAHQWVDNGPGWAVVQLPTAEEVLALEPDLSLIPAAMIGAIGACPAGSEHGDCLGNVSLRCAPEGAYA